MSAISASEDTIQEVWYEITAWFAGGMHYAPTQQELAQRVGKSTAAVWYCLQILRARGMINFKDNSPRGLALRRPHPRYRREYGSAEETHPHR